MTLQQKLADWLRYELKEAGARGLVFGLSGGVDSATAGALAVQAVGSECVLAAIMPCQSLPIDARLARDVATTFDMPTVTIHLDNAFENLIENLPPTDHQLAAANIKPRLRMIALYYLAQTRNYLVLGSGNRSERMVGYFTKYGDGGVDLLPLGDIYKTEVWELARDLGVPQQVVERAPSAGLWPGQTDEQELGISYKRLDRVLKAMASGDTEDIPASTLSKVQKMVAQSAHKRALPPMYPRNEL